jgi:CheY-like chemotaxis protein
MLIYQRTHAHATGHLARSNADLTRARSADERASQAKSEFLANMSHELRTPMTAILGYAELLGEEGAAHPELRQDVEAIQHHARQLLHLITDMLDVSRMQSGRVDLERVAFGPEQLGRQAAALLHERAEAKALDLSVRVRAPLPERVQGDPVRVQQVLVHLISNAIKFTNTGSVEVRVSARDDEIRYEVVDTGVGLTEAEQRALRRPLGEAVEGESSVALGLGLLVSRLLCELMGGELQISSTRGAGSSFAFQIPAPRAEVPSAPAQARPAETQVPAALGHRVLLAEDSPDSQALLGHLLRKGGAVVTIAGNGQEAIEQVEAALQRDEPFALVLMDLQMPVLDGHAAVRELRRRGHTLPIVALTAHALDAERLRCLEGGFDAFATKPIDRRTLLTLVQEWSAPAKQETPSA